MSKTNGAMSDVSRLCFLCVQFSDEMQLLFWGYSTIMCKVGQDLEGVRYIYSPSSYWLSHHMPGGHELAGFGLTFDFL